MKTHRLAAFALLTLPVWLAVSTYAQSPVAPAPAGLASGFSVAFIENAGQFDPKAHLQTHAGNATAWLAEDAVWITLVDQML